MDYDIFISHASEDKHDFVRELAQKLKKQHISVWYDEFTLIPGTSLRKSIDKGLVKSRYGLVVFSEAFFKKEWTQWELNGLIQKLHKTKANVIIPIWYDISYNDLYEVSPSLADIVGIIYSGNIDEVVKSVMKVVKPEGSTLIKAREILIEYGANPPAVTDDWWIDVVEFLGTDYHLNRWGFNTIPNYRDKNRSEYIAWAAMQMHWQEMADVLEITQITKPNEVLEFINDMPGLKDMCQTCISTIAIYAPQLTIRGNGGFLEELFEEKYISELKNSEQPRLEKAIFGSGLTTTGLPPKCSEELSLRDSVFGEYTPSTISCNFVQGPLMGPSPKYYENFDYLIWLASKKSLWLPNNIREYLLKGMIRWNVWIWDKYEDIDSISDIPCYKGGQFHLSLIEADSYDLFNYTDALVEEVKDRLRLCKYYLELEESIDELHDIFCRLNLIENWFLNNDRRKQLRNT